MKRYAPLLNRLLQVLLQAVYHTVPMDIPRSLHSHDLSPDDMASLSILQNVIRDHGFLRPFRDEASKVKYLEEGLRSVRRLLQRSGGSESDAEASTPLEWPKDPSGGLLAGTIEPRQLHTARLQFHAAALRTMVYV